MRFPSDDVLTENPVLDRVLADPALAGIGVVKMLAPIQLERHGDLYRSQLLVARGLAAMTQKVIENESLTEVEFTERVTTLAMVMTLIQNGAFLPGAPEL